MLRVSNILEDRQTTIIVDSTHRRKTGMKLFIAVRFYPPILGFL